MQNQNELEKLWGRGGGMVTQAIKSFHFIMIYKYYNFFMNEK